MENGALILGSISLQILFWAAYFTPALIAWRVGHKNKLAIFVANMLLGWTVLGWIIILVWALIKQEK